MSTVLSGVLRGAGRQQLGAGIMAAVSWGIGLPLQAVLAFSVGWGVAGMWLGAAVSSTIQAVVEARAQPLPRCPCSTTACGASAGCFLININPFVRRDPALSPWPLYTLL